MCKLLIKGGRQLSGHIDIQGSKNAVLPMLAAAVLAEDVSVIDNCPALTDVETSVEILRHLGCRIKREGNTIEIDAKEVSKGEIPESLMSRMRSSITFLGALTARCKSAKITSPGGCELGPRPIDLHIKALRSLGVKVTEEGGLIYTKADKITGNKIYLAFPSVGATENIMLTAAVGNGTTVITNAAREPEIKDLQKFLVSMGAKISGAGTDVITIEGVKKLHGARHKVISDRIVAATYLCAIAITGGRGEIGNVYPEHLNSVLASLKDSGSKIETKGRVISIEAPKRPLPVDIKTMPFPGFPTDAQALFSAMLSVASGTSIIVENIFENRFRHCEELCRMGADIKINGRVCVITGTPKLTGARVTAMELRGGAALAIAGCAAQGETEIKNITFLDRGYVDIAGDLASLGADIKRI
jgi:UDP-N-acetylglucosamine 1-carboxyvinyltransferase